MHSKWGLAIGLLLIIWGGLWGFAGISSTQQARESREWPTVEGQILSSWVSEGELRDPPSYYAHVNYSYVVNGVQYDGKRISFGISHGSRNYAESIIDKYPAGKLVPVHYDPSDPTVAVLEVGDPSGELPLNVGVPLGLFAGGVVLSLWGIGKLRFRR